jgi:ubiquinone biosynthesis protein UbiJ
LLSTSIYKPVEKLVNRGIEQSAEATELCRELDGRRLRIQIDMQPLNLQTSVRVDADDGRIWLANDSEARVDVEVSGTLTALARMLLAVPGQPSRFRDVRINGDADVAEKFRVLIHTSRPNLEQELLDIAGDDLGPQLNHILRRLRHWATDALHDISDYASDYLLEDGQHLVARREAESFFAAVDEIANDLARAEERVAHLRSQIQSAHTARE